MPKATRYSAVLLFGSAIGLFAASLQGFAEVQNVKVGGDVTIRGFFGSNLDLNDGNAGAAAASNGEDHFAQSTIGVNIGADLTENVSAFLRLASEYGWGVDTSVLGGADPDTHDVELSQAYVTLKELFYSPLTVRLGTQPIQWGRGLVLGSNLLPTVLSTGGLRAVGGDRNLSSIADEFTDFTSFDAARATLDLGDTAGMPLTVDAVYIKLDENLPQDPDDVNLFGVNVGTRSDAMHSEFETYYLVKRDRAAFKHGTVNTFGIRGSASPVENSKIYGELAYQTGKRATQLDAGGLPTGGAHQAWLANLGLEVALPDVAMTPAVGAEWIMKTGKDVDNDFQGWDPIAPSYFPTPIRSYQVRSTVGGLYPVAQAGVTSAFTNQHDLALYGSLKPAEDLTAASRLSWFVLDEGAIGVAGTDSERNKFLGTEWDTKLVYNYTDDVTFGLGYGIFWPGSAFRDPNDNTAQKLVTEVALKF